MLKPSFKILAEKENSTYGRFALEPLEQGYGLTLGNSLRRCLLTSISGAVVVEVKIDKVKHQFSTLKGLKEDIVEFILNLKQVRFQYDGNKKIKLNLEVSGKKKVTAADIQTTEGVEVINKDLKLATLTASNSKLKATLWVKSGYGYSPAEERKSTTFGVLPIDASFSPIKRVIYKVQATRVGRRTDFDKLIIEIWTDGSVKPKKALDYAAEVLTGYFNQIVKPVIVKEAVEEKKIENEGILKLTVEELNLPTRIANALRKGGYGTVKDLTQATKGHIANVKNLGKKSVETLVEKLKEKGVGLKDET